MRACVRACVRVCVKNCDFNDTLKFEVVNASRWRVYAWIVVTA